MKQNQYKAVLLRKETLAKGHYYTLRLKLDTDDVQSPLPGQFVQLKADCPGVLLRRPISIANYDPNRAELLLLIQVVGKATRYWHTLPEGATLDLIAPLGNAFNTTPSFVGAKPLLVGGGVGIAPMLMLGKFFSQQGVRPTVLCGARTSDFIMFAEEFSAIGDFYCTTEDASLGESGFVTDHSIWEKSTFSSLYTCGPLPMMKAVARKAMHKGIPCEVSLENKMACGIGACLCCVEPTVKGNVCTCTEGPVFPIEQLLWT